MDFDNLTIGVVGLGMMGSSIAADLLMHGQRVVALSPVPNKLDQAAPQRINYYLDACWQQGLLDEKPAHYQQLITYTDHYRDLQSCELVLECVVEKIAIKKEVFAAVERVVAADAIITTNTSAIPINDLQPFLQCPERFFGMHFAEPAFTTRFLEIICGEQSDLATGEALHALATRWGKEPTLVRKDIRGFITNRLMYALYREAFYLVENKYATIEDVDRACKNDAGHWMTFCGPFRYMDLTGLQAYHHVMKDLFPTLSNQTTTPRLIDEIAQAGGNGIANGNGFYQYTPEQATQWEKAFEDFSFAIRRLSAEHTLTHPAEKVSASESL